MTGALQLAVFMALVVIGAGMPLGLFTRGARATTPDIPAAPEEGNR